MAADEDPAAAGDSAARSAPAAPRQRRGRLLRWARRLAALGALALLALLGLFLTRETLLHPLLCDLAAWAGNRAGYEVRVGALHTDWWSELSIEDVEVRAGEPDSPLRALDLDRARLEFALPALVRGGLDGLAAVEVGRGRVELDLRRAPAAEEPEAEDRGEPGALPTSIPSLTAESLALRLTTTAGALEVDDLRATPAAGECRLSAARVAWSGGVDVAGPAAVDVAWRADRHVRFRRLAAGEVVRAGSGEVDLARLGDGALGATFSLELPAEGRAAGELSWADGEFAVRLAESRVALAPTVAAVAGVGLTVPTLDTLAGLVDLDGDLRAGERAEDFVARVQLAGRDVEYEGRRAATLTAGATIRADGIVFDRVEAREGAQRVVVTEATLPFEDLLAGLRGTARVDVDDLGRWLRPAADGEELPPHRLVVSGAVEGGRLRLDGGRLDVAGGGVELRAGALDLVPGPGGTHGVTFDLGLDVPDLATLGELAGRSGWSGRLVGNVELSGSLDAPVGRAVLSGEDVGIERLPLGTLEVEVEADGDEVRLARLAATSDELRVAASGAWGLRTQALRGANVQLDAFGVEALGFDPGGSLAASASLDGPWREPSGTVALAGTGLAVAGTPLEDLVVDARAEAGRITVERLGAGTPYGALSAAGEGTVDPRGDVEFDLTALTLRAEESDLRLAAPVRIARDATGLRLGRVELAGTAGSLAGDARFEAGVWSGELDARGLHLDAFLAPLLPEGTTTGAIEARASLAAGGPLEYALTLADVALDPRAPAATIETTGRWEGEVLELHDLVVSLGGAPVLTARGRLPHPDGRPGEPLELEAHASLTGGRPVAFPLRGQVARVSGQAEAALVLGGTWARPTGSITVLGDELDLVPRELVQPLLVAPARLDLELRLGEVLELTRLDAVLPERLTANASGELAWSLDLTRALRGDLEGLLDAEVDAKGIVTLTDPGWTAEYLGARRVGGNFRADARLRGALGEPRLEGNVAVQGGSIKYTGLPELEKLALDLALSSTGVVIRDARGESGSAEFTLNGRVDRGDAGPVFDLGLTGENILLQRSSSVRLRSDMELALTGPLDALLLSGGLHLVNSRFMQQVDLLSFLDVRRGGVSSAQRGITLPSFREGPLATMRFDVDVDTREPISLLGNVARGDIGLDLHLGGTGEVLVPTGTVFVNGGRVALPSGTMRFDRGLVTFSEDDPYVPRLDLNGEARLAGYDVELRIEGPLDEIQIEPTVYPPLDRRDALLLVLTGRVPVTGEAAATATQSLGFYLAKDLARRWASEAQLSDSDRESLIDRLVIVSGRDVSRSGVMTLEVSYRVLGDIGGESGATLVVGERDVYEEYNIGLRFLFRTQ